MELVGTSWSTLTRNRRNRDRGVSILGGTGWNWNRGVFRLD